jgi:lipopolysaccharide exporter
MLKLIQYLQKSPFVRNMSIVMTGTAVAQVIGFALTPIISRLFSLEDFGVFGSFSSVLGVVIAFVTLQYSQAVMLPKEEKDAVNVFAVSILSVFIITFLGFLFAFVFSDWLLKILSAPKSRWLLWFLPFGIFVAGINQAFQAWCIRRKAFTKTASSQIIRAGSGGVLNIAAGFFQLGSSGLVASSVVANGLASVNFVYQVFCLDKALFKSSLAWKRIGRLAVEYRDFPLYSATQNMMNALSLGLPVLLLAHFFGIAVAGAYAFGARLLQVPMSFILTSLRQVLFQKACETHHQGGKLLPLYMKITAGLFVLVFFPSVVLFIWSPQIFAWVFGSQWYAAGEFARWLVLWFMFGFCNVPSTLFARILRMQRQLFFFDLSLLAMRALTLVLGGLYLNEHRTIMVFSIVGSIMNIALIVWIGYVLMKHEPYLNGKDIEELPNT